MIDLRTNPGEPASPEELTLLGEIVKSKHLGSVFLLFFFKLVLQPVKPFLHLFAILTRGSFGIVARLPSTTCSYLLDAQFDKDRFLERSTKENAAAESDVEMQI